MKKMAKATKPVTKAKPTGAGSKEKCAEPYKQVSTEFDKDFNSEKGKNGYGKADESNIYNQFEDKECGTPLDGQALSKEIGGTQLTKELYNRDLGAGFKDRKDL